MLSEKASEDLDGKLARVVEENGGTLDGLKCDDVYRELFPDQVDLHEFRNAWQHLQSALISGESAVRGKA